MKPYETYALHSLALVVSGWSSTRFLDQTTCCPSLRWISQSNSLKSWSVVNFWMKLHVVPLIGGFLDQTLCSLSHWWISRSDSLQSFPPCISRSNSTRFFSLGDFWMKLHAVLLIGGFLDQTFAVLLIGGFLDWTPCRPSYWWIYRTRSYLLVDFSNKLLAVLLIGGYRFKSHMLRLLGRFLDQNIFRYFSSVGLSIELSYAVFIDEFIDLSLCIAHCHGW